MMLHIIFIMVVYFIIGKEENRSGSLIGGSL
jgi:hypothetical protein